MSTALTTSDIARWRAETQLLGTRTAEGPLDVVRHLLGVQGERFDHSAWAIAVRCTDPPSHDTVEATVGSTLVRTHTLRPTWFLIDVDDLGWVVRLTRPRLRRLIDNEARARGVGVDELDRGVDHVVRHVEANGPQRRAQLAAALREAGLRSDSDVVALVAATAEVELVLCSGPRSDGHHTYDLVPDRVRREPPSDPEAALGRLALRYVAGHGPVTEADLAYWATLTRTSARSALASVREHLDTFDLDGLTYVHAAGDGPPPTAPRSDRVHLLHLFDEMYRGYQASRHVVDAPDGRRQRPLGLVLSGGRVAARCNRTLDGDVVRFEVHPLRPLTDRELRDLRERAAQYARWLGRTPVVDIHA